jgi:hypothetical protein
MRLSLLCCYLVAWARKYILKKLPNTMMPAKYNRAWNDNKENKKCYIQQLIQLLFIMMLFILIQISNYNWVNNSLGLIFPWNSKAQSSPAALE